MYLKKWTAYYITNYTNETVACWSIKDVKWAYEHTEGQLEKRKEKKGFKIRIKAIQDS